MRQERRFWIIILLPINDTRPHGSALELCTVERDCTLDSGQVLLSRVFCHWARLPRCARLVREQESKDLNYGDCKVL
jgi:hypothetical protein